MGMDPFRPKIADRHRVSSAHDIFGGQVRLWSTAPVGYS